MLKPVSRNRNLVFACLGVLIGMILCVCVCLAVLFFGSDVLTTILEEMSVESYSATLVPGQTPTVGTRAGQLAPDFALRDSQQRTVRLSSFRGKPVIVNFWASWCPPCRSEMPDLNALFLGARSQGLVVIAVNTGDSDGSGAQAFAREQNLQFTIVWDEGTRLGDQYRVRALPTSLFVDRQGIIRMVVTGTMSRSRMETGASRIY